MENNKEGSELRRDLWTQASHTYSRDDVYYNPLREVKSLADLDRLFKKMNEELEAEIRQKYSIATPKSNEKRNSNNMLLTTKEVIAKYPIGERSLGELARKEIIPSTFHGRRRLFLEGDIEAYFLKHYNGKKAK